MNLRSQIRQERHEFSDQYQTLATFHCAVVLRARFLNELAIEWSESISGRCATDLDGMLVELREAMNKAIHLDSLVTQAMHDGVARSQPHQLSKATERMETQRIQLDTLESQSETLARAGQLLMSVRLEIPMRTSRYLSLSHRLMELAVDLGHEGEDVQPVMEQLDDLIAELTDLGALSGPIDPLVVSAHLDKIRDDIGEATHQFQTLSDPLAAHAQWSERLVLSADAMRERARSLRAPQQGITNSSLMQSLIGDCNKVLDQVDLTHGLVIRASGDPLLAQDWDEMSSLLESAGSALIEADLILSEANYQLRLARRATLSAGSLVSDLADWANRLRSATPDSDGRTGEEGLPHLLQSSAQELAVRLDDSCPEFVAISSLADLLGRVAIRSLAEHDRSSRWQPHFSHERVRASECLKIASDAAGESDGDGAEEVRLLELSRELEDMTCEDWGDVVRVYRIAESANAHYRSINERRHRTLAFVNIDDDHMASDHVDLIPCVGGMLGGGLLVGSYANGPITHPLGTTLAEALHGQLNEPIN